MEAWTLVIERYIRMAKAQGINKTYRKFAVKRGTNRKNGRGGTLTVEQWKAMLKVTGGCYYCGEPETITMEHVMPKSIGGGFTAENIVPACQRCNTARGATFNASTALFIAIEFDKRE